MTPKFGYNNETTIFDVKNDGIIFAPEHGSHLTILQNRFINNIFHSFRSSTIYSMFSDTKPA